MTGFGIAVVGATGLAGQEFLRILQQRRFPVKELRLLASERSAGKQISIAGRQIPVRETASDSFRGCDLAFFFSGAAISSHFAPIASRAGALVIDNCSAWHADPSVPLVVPEVNTEDCRLNRGVIANPSPTAIALAVALYPLHRANPIQRIVVDTYESVSSTGSAALEELSTQSRLVLDNRTAIPHVYAHQIAFNVLPETDVFLDNGYTREEMKLVHETRRVMHAPGLEIAVTCVRVPVYVGHSAAVHLEFGEPMRPEVAREILADAPGVKLLDDPAISLYPMPWEAAGHDEVLIGRIRQDLTQPNGLAMWVVADNVRKGTALNALQIVETMVGHGWLEPGAWRKRNGGMTD